MDVIFFGKYLGEASGWDGMTGENWWVYDFVPNAESEIPLSACKCLEFDEVRGQIHEQDEFGNNHNSFQIGWVLVKLGV